MNARALIRFCLGALVVLAAELSPAAPADVTLAVLPFENLSSSQDAAAMVQQQLSGALQKKGWTIAPVEQVEAVLAARRIRYVDSLDDESRRAVLTATGAVAYLAGSVYAFESGRNPVVSFSARILRADGTTAWSDATGLAASDTERVLGFGRASTAAEVLNAAVTRIAKRLPDSLAETALPHGPSRPMFLSRPASWNAADLDPTTPHLICVLPLENNTSTPEASKIVGDILALRLSSVSGFEVVSPSRLREAARAAHLASLSNVSNAFLRKLAPHVGTTLFLRGTIYTYSDITGNSDADPAIQLDLTLVDVEAGRVLWAAQHERRGTDYEGLLLLGASSNAVLLADRVITELIDAAGEQHDDRRSAEARANPLLPSKHSSLRTPRIEGEHR